MELVYQNMIYSFNCVYKDGLVSAGCDYSERKLLRCFCDDKKNKAEHDDVFKPHFFYGEQEYLWCEPAHFQGDCVAGHAKDHTENHD